MIKVDNLCMSYGPFKALDKVSFEARPGEVVGLLGPNGAGKSTTMKILTTYLHPRSGQVNINGIDVLANPLAVREEIGYLPEILPLYVDMEVGEYLEFVAEARGLRGFHKKERIDWVVDKVQIRPMYRKLCRELSKGYKQRVGIAQALIHDPKVVILDEPTSGLDPLQIQEIRKLIRELGKEKTVLLSTHILQEAQAVADRIVIINRGRIVGDGSLEELRKRAHRYQKVVVGGDLGETDPLGRLRAIPDCVQVLPLPHREQMPRRADFEILTADPERVMRAVGEVAAAQAWKLSVLKDAPYSLEETFMALTEKKGGRV